MANVQLPHWPTWLWSVAAVVLVVIIYHLTMGGRRA